MKTCMLAMQPIANKTNSTRERAIANRTYYGIA
jgi:hypothetical protein